MSKRPRVVIDARMIEAVPHGIGRYVTRLAQGLDALRGGDGHLPYKVVFLLSPEAHARKGYHPVFERFATVPVAAPFLSSLREWRELPRVLRRQEAALYHSPSLASLPRCPCPWVQTVHDLNHLRFGGLAKRLYYARVLKPFARRARALITVSESARREIAQWTGISEASIQVAWNALDPATFDEPAPEAVEAALRARGLERGRYFLCIANEKPHKNLPLLLAAHARYRREATDPIPLALNGPGASSDGVVRLGFPDDRELASLVRGARAMVFPSLYEGFGLPPVEAAAVGTPVIASDIPPHREGLRDLKQGEVRWADPTDEAAWVAALGEAGRLERVSEESRARLRERFDPLRLGRHMDRVYRRVLGLPTDTKFNIELKQGST